MKASTLVSIVVLSTFFRCGAVRLKVEQLLHSNKSISFVGLGDTLSTSSGRNYVLERELGKGAYGTAYKARDEYGDYAVVKVIDLSKPEAIESMKQEMHIFNALRRCKGYPHANVIEYKDVYKKSEREGIVVMEYAGGGSLMSNLYDGVSVEVGSKSGLSRDFGTSLFLDEGEAKKVFRMLAAGVSWLSSCGIMHQDLKPDNIVFTSDMMLKIIDFGLATHFTDPSGPDANMYYNLASQPNRLDRLDMATFDDFALGMMLAEFGTGVPPYFNPGYDYESTNNAGNLGGEMGILYVKWPLRLLGAGRTQRGRDQGDTGLFWPKKALGQGELSVRDVVGEVAGRQAFFIKEGMHFPYTSALDKRIPEEYAQRSWLYRSPQAIDLLEKLMKWKPAERIKLVNLLGHPWFMGQEAQIHEAALTKPQIKPVKEHFLPGYQQGDGMTPQKKPAVMPAGHERPVEIRQNIPKLVQQTVEPIIEKSGPPPCSNSHIDTSGGRSRQCQISVYDNQPCSLQLICKGGGTKNVVVDRSMGFMGRVEIPDCQACTKAR